MLMPHLFTFLFLVLEIGWGKELLSICDAHFVDRFQNPRNKVPTCQCFCWYVCKFRFAIGWSHCAATLGMLRRPRCCKNREHHADADLKSYSESKPCSTSEEGLLLLTHEHMSLAGLTLQFMIAKRETWNSRWARAPTLWSMQPL